MASERPLGIGKLTVVMLLLVVLGTPLLALVWETLNRLLAGVVQPLPLVLSAVALVLLVGVLKLTARVIGGWEGERRGAANRPPEEMPR